MPKMQILIGHVAVNSEVCLQHCSDWVAAAFCTYLRQSISLHCILGSLSLTLIGMMQKAMKRLNSTPSTIRAKRTYP